MPSRTDHSAAKPTPVPAAATAARTIALPITGMSCASCAGRVERALTAVPGVTAARVNPLTDRAEVDTDRPGDRAALVRAVEGAGYGVPKDAADIAPPVSGPVTLAVAGMTCASCVGRVERALLAVPGVVTAVVNLMTERASITGTAPLPTLVAAVEQAGYEASATNTARPGGDAPAAALDPTARREAEARQLRRSLIVAALLSLPVIALEMGGHAIPAFHHWTVATLGQAAPILAFVLTTMVLAGPGRRFYLRGIPALLRGAPDMNSLVAIGTLAAWGYSTVATFLPALLPQGAAQVYFEAAATIVTLILLGRWLEARAKGRSSAAIARLIGMQPRSARRRSADGTVAEVPLSKVAAGDLLEIRPGERLPVDGLVTEGSSRIDEAPINGEPMPVAKTRGDGVTGGTVNQTGALTIRATAVGEATVLSQIIRLVEAAQADKLPIQAVVDKVTRWFVPAVMVLALATFGLWMVLGPEPRLGQALVHAVAVLIVACPCAMGLATPVSIMVGTGRGAELGVLFRRGDALQRLADVKAVALDKTGTLTEGRPALSDLHLDSGFEREPTLALIAALESRSEHPLARAITAEVDGPLAPVADFRSVTGQGIAGLVGQPGAQRSVLVGNAALLAAEGVSLPPALSARAARLAADGRTAVFAAVDGRAAAVLGIADRIKSDTPEAIAALHRMGLPVTMISGDNRRTAEAVARPLGIDHVLAEVMPAEKLAEVQALRAAHGTLVYVGDGINDAPALAGADIGIAIGTGIDVAIESADVVLMSGSLRGVPTAIGLSRAVLANIRQNLFWAFAYNAALIPVAMGVLYPRYGITMSPVLAAGAMAMSSVFVLGNALRLRGFQPEGRS